MGIRGADDAGVYRIGESCALVQTTDIITPLVDEPFTFGRIAAANAISDVYAMGGRPVTAMNLLFAPSCLAAGVLAEILRGGSSVMAEAGVCLVGGHTVEDDELKYGLAVTGLIEPEKIIRNNTPQPGDRLILTKPLGTGIISTALKGELADERALAAAIKWMTTLNRQAAELMVELGANAATDITGFGLIGHACEMAADGVTLVLQLAAVPLMDSVPELVAMGMIPAGCYRNRDYYSSFMDASGVDPDSLMPLFDPQTSGGMLIALPEAESRAFLEKAAASGLSAVEIGAVVRRREKAVVIC